MCIINAVVISTDEFGSVVFRSSNLIQTSKMSNLQRTRDYWDLKLANS